MDTDQTDLLLLQLENLGADQLIDLIFELGLDSEVLSGSSRAEKARNLVLYMKQAGRLAELRDRLPQKLEEIAQEDGRKALQTLHVYIPMGSHVTIEDFLLPLNRTLRALNIVYLVFATLYSKDPTSLAELSTLIAKDYQARLADILKLAPTEKAQAIHMEFEAAQSVQDEWLRAVILNELVPYLSETDRRTVYLLTERELNKFHNKYLYAINPPASLLEHLTPEPFDPLDRRQRYVWINDAWMKVFRTLAPYLSEADKAAVNEYWDIRTYVLRTEVLPSYFRPGAPSAAALRVESCHYGSPVTVDLLGIAGVIEELRNLIKDLTWRGSYEREIANLDKEEREILLEQKRLENDGKRLDILLKHVEVGERLLGSKLNESDRAALMAIFTPQVQALQAAKIAPGLDDPS